MKLSKLLIVLNLSIGLTTALYVNAAPKVVEKVAAVVNKNVILESDVNDMIKTIKATTDRKNLPNDKVLRRQVIDRLIVDNLILQRAASAKITVSDVEVTAAISRIAAENGMSINQLRSKLSTMGMSYSAYRERIHKDMLIEQARMNELRPRINISDREVENLAKTLSKQPTNNTDVNVSHILIAIPENASKTQIDEATKKANDIINRLRKGENFAALASSYSSDDLAQKGGAMGWHKPNELPSIFEERVIRAAKGSVIGPIKSGAGLHILKIVDTRSPAPQSMSEQEIDARHILIKTNVVVTDAKAKQKISDIRKSIVNGSMSFQAAAKAYSEDTGSADSGGDLGWNTPDRYDSAFKNALLKLKKGEISQPVKSAFGWHLIQLIDTRKTDSTESSKKEYAYRLIFNKKFTQAAEAWVQELKGDAYIKIADNENRK